MNANLFGGIPVRNMKDALVAASAATTLGEGPYEYELVRLNAHASFEKKGPARYCVYVLAAPVLGLTINGMPAVTDEFALGDAAHLQIQLGQGEATMLVASQASLTSVDELRIAPVTAAKRVEKPWGHEIWLTGDPSKVFAFKRILLKAGNKTSLQFHRVKRETNFILNGVAALHFNPDPSVTADAFQARQVDTTRLEGPCVADVFPGLVHRLEAIEDLLLYEVSTPELDDVIRLADDAGRDSGRIAGEHARMG
jgi:mannose-6-phosphate isomerase